MPNKRDILSGNRESGMALKKREFTPESSNVDTYVDTRRKWQNQLLLTPLIMSILSGATSGPYITAVFYNIQWYTTALHLSYK